MIMKLKTIFLVCLSILMIFVSTSCGEAIETAPEKQPGGFTEEGSQGLSYQFDSQGKYYTVTGIGTCTDKAIVIPKTHAGYPVKAIADGAFQVGKEADLSIRDSMILLSADSTATPPVHLTDKDPSNVDKDGNLIKIESVEIPDSITEIGDSAFAGCESLEDIEMTNLVNMIGTDAFKDTAFYNDPDNWENGALYLKNHLVEVKRDFAGVLTVKEGTKHIAASALKDCTGLSAVEFPESIATIGACAFMGCTALTSIDLAFAGIDIGERAFYGCTALVSVKIADDSVPSTLPQVDLDKIAKLSFPESNDDTIFVDLVFSFSRNYFTYGGEDFVYSAVIGKSAFAGCSALTDVVIGKNLKAIGSRAFSECTALKTISLENLTVVSDIRDAIVHQSGMKFEKTELSYVFSGCTSLESVTLPEGILTLDSTFTDCTALKSVTLPSTVTTLRRTFEWCSSLEGVSLPDGLMTISHAAFRGCIAMKSMTLPDSVTAICDNAFAGLPTSCEISLGDAVQSIGAGAFENCQTLTFRGMSEKWQAISRADGWYTNENNTITVHCTNGDVTE